MPRSRGGPARGRAGRFPRRGTAERATRPTPAQRRGGGHGSPRPAEGIASDPRQKGSSTNTGQQGEANDASECDHVERFILASNWMPATRPMPMPDGRQPRSKGHGRHDRPPRTWDAADGSQATGELDSVGAALLASATAVAINGPGVASAKRAPHRPDCSSRRRAQPRERTNPTSAEGKARGAGTRSLATHDRTSGRSVFACESLDY